MRPFNEFINEKIENLDGLKVYIDPSIEAIQALMRNCKGDREWAIRYLIDDHKIYCWDAYEATHDEASQRLGIEIIFDPPPLNAPGRYCGGCGGFEATKQFGWSHFGYWENDNPRLKKYETLFNVEMPRQADGSVKTKFETRPNPYQEVKVRAHERKGTPVHSYTRTFPHLHESVVDRIMCEKVEDIDGTKVYINPSNVQLKALLKRLHDYGSERGEVNDDSFQTDEYSGHLRYLWADGDIYCWDSWGEIHSRMSEHLGLGSYGATGYFGLGRKNWSKLKEQEFGGYDQGCNSPDSEEDFWQLGSWPKRDAPAKAARYKDMFRIGQDKSEPHIPTDQPNVRKMVGGIWRGGEFYPNTTNGGRGDIDALYKELNPKTQEWSGGYRKNKFGGPTGTYHDTKDNRDVHVSAHTRDGHPVHAYTRSRPSMDEGFLNHIARNIEKARGYPNLHAKLTSNVDDRIDNELEKPGNVLHKGRDAVERNIRRKARIKDYVPPSMHEGIVRDRYKAWSLNRKYPNEPVVGNIKHANKDSEIAAKDNAKGAPNRFYLKPDEDMNKDLAANEYGKDKSYQRSKEVQKRRGTIHAVKEGFTRPSPTFQSNGAPKEHDEVQHQGIQSFKDKYKFSNALKMGREQTIPAYKWRQNNTQNTEAGSSRPAKEYNSLDASKRNRVNKQVHSGNLEMPITMKGENGNDHLLAGNTRATRLSMLNKPTKVLRIKEDFSTFILEKTQMIEGVAVHIDPPVSVLKTLLQKQTMRYMIHNKTVYTWSAEEYIHGEMAERLGLDEDGFKGGMPNWFDNSGYWGVGIERHNAVADDIMPTVWKAAIKPKGDGDFWQVGGWISSPKTVKYELPMHIRGTGKDEFMVMRKRDIESIDKKNAVKFQNDDWVGKGYRLNTQGNKVHVQAHTRDGGRVGAYDRSYPTQTPYDWGDEDGKVYEETITEVSKELVRRYLKGVDAWTSKLNKIHFYAPTEKERDEAGDKLSKKMYTGGWNSRRSMVAIARSKLRKGGGYAKIKATGK